MNPAVQRLYIVIRDLLGLDENTQMRIGRTNDDMEWDDLVVVDALAPMTRDSQTQSYDGDAEEMSYGGIYSCPTVVSIYGPDAYDRALDLVQRMRSQAALELQRTNEVAVYGFSAVTDVKALTGVQYSGRVDIESVVKYNSATAIDTLRIDELQYDQIDDDPPVNYQKPVAPPSPTPAPTCFYPLDATEAEILAFGADGKLTMSNGDQTLAHTYSGGAAGTETYAAFSSGFPSDPSHTYSTTSGITLIIEIVVDSLGTNLATSNSRANLSIFWLDASFNEFFFQLGHRTYNTTFVGDFIRFDGTSLGYPDDYLLSVGDRIGIYYDASEGKIGYTVKGTAMSTESAIEADLGFANTDVSAFDFSDYSLIVQGEERYNSDLTGTTKMTFTVDATETTLTYPAGTTDPCGNLI